MRIIGEGTRDYYDTAGWADQSRVFNRVRYSDEKSRQNKWRLPILFPTSVSSREADDRGVHTTISFGLCCVAGDTFPWARKLRWVREATGGEVRVISSSYVYDPDQVRAEVRSVKKRRRGGMYWSLMREAADHDQFMRLPSDVMSSWCLDRRAATAILFPARPEHYKDPYDLAHGMLNCDGLGSHELYKVLDPSTAHMRIDGYVSGVLPVKEEPVQIADEDRIRKAGFDDQSFRTRPGTRKQRRRGGPRQESA